MTIVFRGIQNSLRSPLRAVIAIFLLTLSIALIISMLIAHDSIAAAAAIVSDARQRDMLYLGINRSQGTMIAGVIATVGLVMITLITIIREQRHEIGVIKAIGGGTSRIIAQFITEITVLTMAGLLAGLLVGVSLSPHATQFLSASYGAFVPLVISGDVFLQTISFTFAAIAAGSILPAIVIASIRPIEATRAG